MKFKRGDVVSCDFRYVEGMWQKRFGLVLGSRFAKKCVMGYVVQWRVYEVLVGTKRIVTCEASIC